MPALNISPLVPRRFTPTPVVIEMDGWDYYHDTFADELTNQGLRLSARPDVAEEQAISLIKPHTPINYSMSGWWKTFKVKISFKIIKGDIDDWTPLFFIGSGLWPPKIGEISTQQLRPIVPKREDEAENAYTATGERKFAWNEYSRRAHPVIGFRVAHGVTGQIIATKIRVYGSVF